MGWAGGVIGALAQEPQREHFAIIGEQVFAPMLIAFAVAMAIFLVGLFFRWRTWRRVKRANPQESFLRRMRRLIRVGLLQRKVIRQVYAGLLHTLIYTGFIVLLLGTILVALDFDIATNVFGTPFLVGNTYLAFEIGLELFGLFLIVGLGLALWRRLVTRPKHLRSGWGDYYLLLILLLLAIQGFVLEGIRLGATPQEPWYPYSFVGYALSRLFVAVGLLTPGVVSPALESTYYGLWWFHAFATFAFIASIPYTKFLHLVTSPLNTYTASLRPYGQLPTPFRLGDLTGPEAGQIQLGAANTTYFSRQDRLMFDACTECGRCTSVCPAWTTGKPLDPMRVILRLKAMTFQERRQELERPAPYVVGEEELWACTTCNACVEICPVAIRHVAPIVELRRNLVMEQGAFPASAQEALQSMETNFNPYGMPWDQRAAWAEGLAVPLREETETADLDLLYWVGCAASFDPRNQQVARALVKILHAAGLRFAILGTKEKCTGDPARRIGNEYLAQTLMEGNVETLRAHGVKRIVVTCPHCFNTFRNEYPEFGGEYEVVHHTELIQQLLASGRLRLRKTDLDLAWHDSCYLGRHNSVYEAPREALRGIPGLRLREMPRHRGNQLCCGAGGGRIWMEETRGRRINVERTEEAIATRAGGVATACPFCTTMMEDGIKAVGSEASFRTLDLAEIVAASLRDQG
ncbi:MAG: heterodisulfide reductase-related iron-sulfur binding cluster [Thermoplasmata archaeon]